jgi:hypothetical protein
MSRRRPYRQDPDGLARSSVISWPDGLTHRKLEALADDIAIGNRWLIHAVHDSRGETWSAASGWPDRFYVRANRAIALELKVPPDTLNDEQRAWLAALDQVPGITARLFTASGLYTRDLTALAELLR